MALVKEKQTELKKLTDEALQSLCKDLEAGKSEQMIQYLDTMARFPKYSFRNILLILKQKPSASYVMGYKSWRSLGRFVQKGESAIRIFAPMALKKEEQERGESDSEEQILFRPVCVFDVSQTEGKELPDIGRVEGEPGGLLPSLKQFAKDEGIKLGYDGGLKGDGVSKCGEILLRLGLEPAVEFHVLVHEIAHEFLHKKKDRPKLTKRQKETEAEAVAYVVSKSVGIRTGTASSDYIQLWDGDTDLVVNSLAAIQNVSARIIQSLVD